MILVLRPEPGASATVARAKALGLDAVATPLFEARPLAWQPPDPAEFDAVMLTSANAPRLGGEGLEALLDLPAYAVGASTARAAVAAGFAQVRHGNADAAALLDQIAGDGVTRLLHLAGREHRPAVHPDLTIERRIVYASDPLDPPPDFAALLEAGPIAMLHSPRASARFASLVDALGDRARVAIAAISPRALAAAGPGWRAGQAAANPDDDALLSLAARMCD